MKIINKRIYFLFLVFFSYWPINIYSEEPVEAKKNLELLIRVFKKGFGIPLKRVEIAYGNKVYYSDKKGQFSLPIHSENKKIMFSKHGYERQIFSISAIDLTVPLDVYLLEGEPDDQAITIHGKKKNDVSKKIVTAKETARIAPGGDPVQIAKILPGVRADSLSNEIVIRGSGPTDSKFYVDDLEVLQIFHQIGGISIIPDTLVEDVEFYSGGFDVRYGDATGGVIRLNTKETIPERAKTEYRINVPFYLTLFHEKPLSENSSLIAGIRKSTTEYLLPAVLKDSDITLIPYFSDAHARYYTKNEGGSYKLTLLMSADGIKLSVPSDNTDDESGNFDLQAEDRFFVFGLERKQKISKGLSISATPQLYYVNQNLNFSGGSTVKGYVAIIRAPTELKKTIGRRKYLTIGFDPGYFFGKFKVVAPRPPASDDDPFYDPTDAPKNKFDRFFDSGAIAAWMSYDFSVLDSDITVGGRYFYFHTLKKSGLDPRIRMRYKLQKGMYLKSAIGQYSKSPEYIENTKEFGNTELGYEKSNHYILGLESSILGDRWFIEGQLFFKRTYKFIRNDPIYNYLNNGTKETEGFELFVRRNMTEKTFGWLSYTWSKSKERKADKDPWYNSAFDQTHNLNLALSYKVSRTWEFGSRFNYVSGDPYTDVTGSHYNANTDKYEPTYDLKNPFNERLPDKNSLDVFATFDSFKDTWKLIYRFGIRYLTLGEKKTSLSYNYDYSKKEFKSRDLPPIPFFEVKGQF